MSNSRPKVPVGQMEKDHFCLIKASLPNPKLPDVWCSPPSLLVTNCTRLECEPSRVFKLDQVFVEWTVGLQQFFFPCSSFIQN